MDTAVRCHDGARVAAVARRWIGTPYVHQQSLRGIGCDCLGLLRGVWRELNGTEPERPPAYTPFWAEETGRETMLEAARRHLVPAPEGAEITEGDVLLFRYRRHLPARHAGIATGPDAMIHAMNGSGVVEAPIGPWWRRRIAGVFRVPVVTPVEAMPGG